jgi:hypothetical protein
VVMHDRPVGRGYVHLAENAEHPWPRPNGRASEISPPIQLSPTSGRKGNREKQS